MRCLLPCCARTASPHLLLGAQLLRRSGFNSPRHHRRQRVRWGTRPEPPKDPHSPQKTDMNHNTSGKKIQGGASLSRGILSTLTAQSVGVGRGRYLTLGLGYKILTIPSHVKKIWHHLMGAA